MNYPHNDFEQIYFPYSASVSSRKTNASPTWKATELNRMRKALSDQYLIGGFKCFSSVLEAVSVKNKLGTYP